MFLDSGLPKINLTPNAVKTAKKCLIDACKKNRPSAFTSQECVQFFLDQRDGLFWPDSLQTKVKCFFLHLQGDFFNL